MKPPAILLALALAASAQSQPSASDIVRHSLARDSRNFERLKDFTYLQRAETRYLDSSGRVQKTEVSTVDVTIIEDRPYSRLIAKNDRPLNPDEARKAQQRFDNELEKRRKESPSGRAKRLAAEEKGRRESRLFLSEIPDAFQLTLAGAEHLDGRPVWIIDAAPKPGYRGRAKNWELLTKFKGRLWIEQRDYQWVKVEAITIAPVRFGWILAKLAPGARLSFAQSRLNDELWLPARADTKIDARLALFKRYRLESTVTWKDYRKFSSDSKVVSAEELPAGSDEPPKRP